MARKKILSVALATVLSVTTVFGSSPKLYQTVSVSAKETSEALAKDTGETEVVSDAEQVNAGNYGLCDKTKDGAILHAWCWSFNTIKQNLKDIAEAGFTTVQTSPANQCLKGENGGMSIWSENGQGKWEYHYQPTDWKIGNYQLGTRDEFIEMCEEADKYGVKIIVDVLPNHTTPQLSEVSQSLIQAAGGQDKLYHAEGFNSISRWEERFYCTNGAVLGLPDVNTENPGFQKYYLNYLNDLIDCGVDGFRYDTAKHIGLPDDPQDEKTKQYGWKNNFWPVALGNESVDGVSLHNKDQMFIYGEVLQSSGSRDGDYGKIFHLTGSGYGGALRDAIKNKNFSTGNISDWRHATPDKIVTWVESHDTYCNSHESGSLTDWDIRMCWAIIAARATGTPLFYSRPDGSNGSQGNYWGNNKIGAKGNDQFKAPEVVACNHFRNAMVGESEYMSNPNGNNNVLVIERGTKGAVIINLGADLANVKLSKVADGTYTEEVSGKQVQVSGGTLNYTVPGGTVAVVYNPTAITKNPSVSVSKESGDFTEPFELKLTPSNATKATYSINGGDAVEFTKVTTVKIGEGAEIGDKITVKVTAEGEGDPFSETYTYTMAEEPEIPEYKLYVRTKKSDYSSAPMAYVYTGDGASAKKLNGEWPGAAMKEEGDYYVYATNDADSARIIFSYDGGQDPASEQPGYEVSGYAEYDKNSKKVTKFTPPTQKPKTTKTPVKETEPPVKETEPPVKETEPPKTTAPVTETKVPTTTEPAKTTPKPTEEPTITVSKETGTSFSTETMDVKITVPNGTKGTYSVDNGPEKSFTSSATVEVGKGKIADSEVTLKVTASGKTETYTYKKDFDPTKATVKASAVSKIKSLFEIVSDAAEVNADAESDGYYATNPSKKVGKEAKITVDGSFSDWSDDMLVAQGVACDTATRFKGVWENWVMDSYSLYGAWDDENLYIGWQIVNTYDTFWEQDGNGPISDSGKPGDAPQFIAINTGKGNKMTGLMQDGKGIWGADIQYSSAVDNIIAIHSDLTGTPGLFKADSSGASSYAAADGLCLDFKETGIEVKKADGCLPDKIMGVWDPGDENCFASYDLASNWVDMKTTTLGCRTHDTAYDTFYEIKIPFSALGITKDDVVNNGVNIMHVISRGESGMDCTPHDPSMLDNTYGSYGNEPSNSHEKDDTDIITVPLAAVGSEKAIGQGAGSGQEVNPPVVKTPGPTVSSDTEVTEKPEKTAEVTKAPTKTPTKTDEPEETKVPTKTEAVVSTDAPKKTETPTATPKVTKKPASGSDYDGDFTVNFGADRSSPQYQTTALTLKAIPYGGSGNYTYEFKVDGTTIQEASKEDSCEWKGTKGSHTIAVVVKDGDGAQITCEKAYDVEEKDGTPTALPLETNKPEVTGTPSVDNSGKQDTPSGNVTDKLSMSAGANKKSPQAAGTTITLSMDAQGGTAPYKYTITVEGGAYGKTPNVLLNKSSSNSCQWTPTKAGTYKVNFTVEDSKGDIDTQSGSFKVSTSVSVSKFTASKYTVKKGKKVKFSMAAVSKLSSSKNIQYQISVLKSGQSKKTVIRKYSKSKSYSWKTKKKGKYTVYLTAKDTKGNTKTVKLSKKITVK